MRANPTKKLNPKIKAVWRISDAAAISAIAAALIVPGIFVLLLEPSIAFFAEVYCLVCLVLYITALVVFLFIVTPIRYVRWSYELSPDYLDIAYGIIWRKRFIIPFIRVQNTDTRQGPVLRAFDLSSVTVSTAAGSHVIPGLITAEANDVRDRAAEFARLAKEDV